jgi:hypothetical protein
MKPRLYLDIDGVIYGHYGGEWQIRPYAATLVKWAEQYFDIYWLSFNSRRVEVVKTIYCPGEVITQWYTPAGRDERGFPTFAPEDWHPLAERAEKLIGINKTGGFNGEWFLIEDTPPTTDQRKILEDLGCLHRWIVVPDTGSDVLLDVKTVLENYGNTGKLYVPYEWATREPYERDLAIDAEWKGYGKSRRSDDKL